MSVTKLVLFAALTCGVAACANSNGTGVPRGDNSNFSNAVKTDSGLAATGAAGGAGGPGAPPSQAGSVTTRAVP